VDQVVNVLPIVGIVELLKDCAKSDDEVGPVNKDLFSSTGQVVDVRIISKLRECILGQKDCSKWEEVKIFHKLINFVEGVYLANQFKTLSHVLEHAFKLFVSLLLPFCSECGLLGSKHPSLVKGVMEGNQFILLLNIRTSCSVSNLVHVVEHCVVQSFQTGLVQTRLNSSGEKDLLCYQLAHNLKLSYLEDDLRAGVIEVGHLTGEDLVALLECGVEVSNIHRQVVVELFEVLMEVLIEHLSSHTFGIAYTSATDVEPIVSEELIDPVHYVIGDQTVQAYQEVSAEVVLHEAHVTQTEKLVALVVIPR
jgi:hypothetical protein